MWFQLLRCVCVVAGVVFGVQISWAYESHTCLAQKVKSWKPIPLELPLDGVFIPEDGKIWAYTSIIKDPQATSDADRIAHLWVRGETKIDLISRPLVKGRFFYSNKVLTLHQAGRWEVRTINKEGEVLNRIPFLVLKKDNQMAIKPLDGGSLQCGSEGAPSVPGTSVQEASTAEPIGEAAKESAVAPTKEPVAVAAEPEVVEPPIKGDWIVELSLGVAQPLGDVKDDLGLGQSGRLSLTRNLHMFPLETAVTLGIHHSQFAKDDSLQDNSARDTNFSAYYSLVFRPTDRFKWNIGGGIGASRWNARSLTKAAAIEVDNSGVDLSTDAMFAAAYQFKKAYSVSFTAIYRETFGDFNESYVPVMLGLTYEFGGQP